MGLTPSITSIVGGNTSNATNVTSQNSLAYNSFSGSDIRASIGPMQFAQIQAVSYSVTREKAPVYTMGSPDPRSFSRNKRGIAGSLIWVNFDRHALLSLIYSSNGIFIANVDDLRPQFQSSETNFIADGAIYNAGSQATNGAPASATIDQTTLPNIQAISGTSGFKTVAKPWYSDQILPFDITLSGATEYGAATAMKIFGVEILNEGSGVSIDDTNTEMQATFVARLVEPWLAVQTPFLSDVAQTVVQNT